MVFFVIVIILCFIWAILAQRFEPILKNARDKDDGKLIEPEEKVAPDTGVKPPSGI